VQLFKYFFYAIYFWAALSRAASLFVAPKDFFTIGEENILYWHKLVHYKKTFSGFKSIADGQNFFLHPAGRTSPEGEFFATVKMLTETPNRPWGKYQQPVGCAFPERYRFIKSLNIVKNLQRPPCQLLQSWKKGIAAESMTLVFSTSYPNNPASIFGHTFLRFNQSKKQNDLLDYGAAYSAEVDPNDWAPFYAYKGLFGGYPGFFEFSKYYQLVNTYVSAESRDLWEYDLNIPQEGVERILNHMWEIYSTTHFDYFFLDENCSKILGATMEIANPNWNFSETGRAFYLPHDLVQLVSAVPGLVKKTQHRPSIKKIFQSRFNSLTSKQQRLVENIYRGRVDFQQIKILQDTTHKIKILDALSTLLNFRKFKNKGKVTHRLKTLLRKILLERASMAKKNQQVYIIPQNYVSNRPDLAHAPRRVKLAQGRENGEHITSFSYRMGYQDMSDQDDGVMPFSQFEFLSVKARYFWAQKKMDIAEAKIIGITSLHDYSFYDPQLSWRVNFSYLALQELDCKSCHKFVGEGGTGFSFFLSQKKSVLYIMMGVYSEASRHYRGSYTLGGWLEWKIASAPIPQYKFVLSQQIKSNFKETLAKQFYAKLYMKHHFFLKKNLTLGVESGWISKVGDWSRQTYQHELSLGWFF